MRDNEFPNEIFETHISTVFLRGERAYKFFKPVSLEFLDYSGTEDRVAAVTNELVLNRRFAPTVYLGTADVVENDVLTDRILVMRRMPAERRLPLLLDCPEWEAVIRGVARTIAAFHADVGPAPDAQDWASRDGVWLNWRNNFESMNPFVGSALDLRSVDRARTLVHRYLSQRGELFDWRIRKGLVKDGHGDLRAEDIFCLPEGPQILDCLAFSRGLRVADVLADTAFLAMDLDRLAGPTVARRFMDYYTEFSNEHHPASLAHHYVAYRAHVRTKVALLRYGQGDFSGAAEARTYHDLCLRHLEYSAVRLVLVGGGPGTGKSTLARGLGDSMGWIVLNSDELRKDITGHAHGEHARAEFEQGIYTPEVTARLYAALLDQAALLMARGESVIIDASWPSAEVRRNARLLASSWDAGLVELECVAEIDTTKRRVALRNRTGADGASDATPAILDQAMAARDPWPTAQSVSNEGSVTDTLEHALRYVSAPPP